MANPTITINATGITVSGPLIAGEPVAVTASGLSLPEGAALTLALSSRAPNALLASCVLAESDETPGTWTGTLETASRQMAVYFATAAADDTRPAVLELVETTTRDSLSLLVTSIRNSALIPSSSPCAVAPVYIPVPGPPGQGGDPYDQPPEMDGEVSAGTSDEFARGDHRHPSDTSKLSKTGNEETSGYLLVRNTLGVKADDSAQSDYVSLDAYSGRLKITNRRSGVENSLELPSKTGTAARLEDIPATVAPSTDSSASGKPADAKATGDALAAKQDTISDLATIRSGAAAGATAVQPAALSAYRTASAQDEIDGAQDTAISAKYTKPATGIPAGDLAAGVIPSVPSASDATPQMDGTGASGIATTYARGDHRHPSDMAKVSKSGDTMTGSLTVPGVVANAPGLQVIGTNNESVQVGAGGGEGYAVFSDSSGHSVSIGAGGPTEFNVADGDDDFDVALPKNNGTLALQESIATTFSASSTYAVGDYVTHEGLLYKCTTAVATAGAWNAASWSAVAVTDEMGGGGAPKNVWYVGSTTGSGDTISGSTTTGDFVLAAGNVVVVKMSYGVNATSATLNIDGTGAKQISTRSGTTTIPKYFWSSEQAVAFVYSGTYYIPCGMTTATIYNSWGLTSLSSTVSNDETKAATPKAVNTRAPKESPAFTGTPTAPTAAAGTNTTQIATTEFVQTEARYALTAKTPSVSGTAATVACEDRAINDFTVATGITSLTITPPAAVTGRARDFFCRVTLTDSSLPTVTLSGGTIDIGATEVAGMTQGVNLLMFTEISSGHWLASRRSAS